MHKTLTMMAALPFVGVAVTGAFGTQDGPANPAACSIISMTACEHYTALAARPHRQSQPTGHVTVLRFKDVQGEHSSLDLGAPGDTPGDVLFFDNPLRNWSETKAVGRFTSRCTQVTDAAYHCQGTLLLEHGTIELATTTDFSGEDGIVAAVVGGTRGRSGANGEVRITPTSTPGTSSLIVRLDRR